MEGPSTFLRPLFFALPFFLSALIPGRAVGFVAERIMAIVNNEVIALSDVRAYTGLFGGSPETDPGGVLDEMIGQKILLAEARKTGIEPPSPEEVLEAQANLVAGFGGPEAFAPVKERLGLSEDEIHHLIRTRLHIERLIDQRIRSFVFVTPRDVQAYLEANPGAFSGLSDEEKNQSIEKAIRKIKSQEKLENYLDRLKAKSEIRVNFPR